LLKNILAYYGYSSTSPFFLLLSEHNHCDNAATNSNSENARSKFAGKRGHGQRKMSQVLGAFGLLDFTTLRPVLAWRAFWNLRTVYFFNFPTFFFGPRPTVDNWNFGYWIRGDGGPPVLRNTDRRLRSIGLLQIKDHRCSHYNTKNKSKV